MSSSKQIDQQRAFLVCVFMSVAPNPKPPPPPPHKHTVYMYKVYLFIQEGGGQGGRVEPERRLEGKQLKKLGRIYQHG